MAHDGQDPDKTTSDLIIERLADWGVDICFGLTGDQVNGFVESLRTHTDRMRFVHVRHEENAALAAVGYAKFTGRPAACLATAGPGANHLLNGLYDARIDGAPVIAITGLSYHDTVGTHLLQDVPSDRLLDGVCPYNERVMGPAHAVPVTDLAVRSALANRTPSHLAIPIDVQSWTQDAPSPKTMANRTSMAAQPFTLRAPEPQLRAAAAVLDDCSKIAICAGAGARGAGDLVEQVADILGAPVIKAGLGKDAVPDDSPFVTGGMGLIGTRPSHAAFEECDGFLIIGSATPYHEFWPAPGQARAVQIDINADRIALRYPVEVGLVGDTSTVLTDLIPLLSRHEDRSFLETAQQGVADYWAMHRAQAADHRRPMRPQTVVEALTEALPDRAIVTGDAGAVTAWAARLRLRRDMMFSFSGTLCSMGAALPYAIGAQIAHPDRPVIAFTGDGSLSMGMGELASLAQHRLPITVVVMRNDSLALEIWEQNALLGNPQFGNDLHPVDFASVAEACGVRGIRLEDPADTEKVLADALDHPGPVVVEAIVDPHEAPFGESMLPVHAQHITQAYAAGERDRASMADNLLEPRRVDMSPAVQSVQDELRRYR